MNELMAKINQVDTLRKENTRAIARLKEQMKEKANKNAIIDGQQQFFNDLNKVENAVDEKRENLLLKEFSDLKVRLVTELKDEFEKRVQGVEAVIE